MIIKIYQKFLYYILITMIVLLAFSMSFGWQIGRDIINNMFYIWILTLNFRYIYYFIKNNKIVILLLLFFIWISFSSIVSYPDYESYKMFIKYFLLPIIIIITSIKKEHIEYLINAFLIGMFINVLISYCMYFELIGDRMFGFVLHGNNTNPIPFLSTYIQYSVFLSFSIFLTVLKLFKSKNIILKLFLVFLVFLLIVNLFIISGRTGQFTFLMTAICLVIIYFKKNIKYIIYSLISLTIICMLAFNLSSNLNNRLMQGFEDISYVVKDKNFDTSWGARLSSYMIIPNIIKDERFNLFYGMGYCKLNNIIMDIQLKEYGKNSIFTTTFGYLHNTYISIFAGTGFIGLLIFIIFWGYLFFIKIEDQYFNYIRYSNMFVITFQGISNELFYQHEIMLLSAVFISIIIYVTTNNEKEKINE
ncbi:O-antigen ligase family protein [Aliarcobacter lanthieri]|uniref:O-antigen ligase family protein n=1 Tax=Aliarcobacter lanthieri TaxID=1355374 RepID=UPI00047CA900|nr:O-antigen ligase family protein [Aliarcobacter lanthieri]QKF59856.1 O-antigen ligase family protein [Aliarcobacter lanthieri]